MIELLNLEELDVRLRKVDRHIVALLAQRMQLALQVEEVKRHRREPIYRAEVEARRLEEAREWAQERGLNPNFAQAILYLSINESCKVQIAERQRHAGEATEEDGSPNWHKKLKENLLLLTEKVARVYDDKYATAFFATRSYLEFENQILAQEIESLSSRGLALDVGCATGRKSLELSGSFEQVVGYDISPAMIEQAKAKLGASGVENLSFECLDVEQGIPQSDGSASLVIMNMGTASDIPDIEGVLAEAQRVLMAGGKIFLSFYNADALMYRWEFIPWPVSLAAEINLKRHCLDVHFEGQVFSVYARPYTLDEIKKLIPHGIELTRTPTYPTISSLLPNELFDEVTIQEAVTEIDRQLADTTAGAYALVVGRRL